MGKTINNIAQWIYNLLLNRVIENQTTIEASKFNTNG